MKGAATDVDSVSCAFCNLLKELLLFRYEGFP